MKKNLLVTIIIAVALGISLLIYASFFPNEDTTDNLAYQQNQIANQTLQVPRGQGFIIPGQIAYNGTSDNKADLILISPAELSLSVYDIEYLGKTDDGLKRVSAKNYTTFEVSYEGFFAQQELKIDDLSGLTISPKLDTDVEYKIFFNGLENADTIQYKFSFNTQRAALKTYNVVLKSHESSSIYAIDIIDEKTMDPLIPKNKTVLP